MSKKSKRGNLEGTIRERKTDGRWEARIVYRVDGETRPRRKSIYAATRIEAHQRMVIALRDLNRGVAPSNDRLSVERYLTRWLADRKGYLRPSTHVRYTQLVGFITDEIGGVTMSKLSPQHVHDLLRAGERAGLAPATRRQMRAVLRSALTRAMKWGLVATNAAALSDPPRVPPTRPRPLSVEDSQRLLATAADTDMEAVVTVGLMLGLRQSELLGLTWSAVDFDTATVRVDKQLQRVAGEYTLVEPKTTMSRRTIPMPTRVATALRAERSLQMQRRDAAGAEWDEVIPFLVFTTAMGAPRNGPALTRSFLRLLKRAGIAQRRFHDLRSSCASLLAAQGVEITAVRDILGHTSVATTLQAYAAALPARKVEAVGRMEELLGSA